VAMWVSVERSRGEGSVEAQSSICRARGLEVSGDPVFALVEGEEAAAGPRATPPSPGHLSWRSKGCASTGGAEVVVVLQWGNAAV
jgi:hypothetical protein